MGRVRNPGDRRRRGFIVVAGILLVGMVGMTGYGIASSFFAASSGSTPASAPAGGKSPSVPTLTHSKPKQLTISSINVDAPVRELGMDEKTRSVQMPAKAADAGWFSGSVTPGQQGAAILTGYIGLDDQKGAFESLNKLKPGDEIAIRREDGKTAVYTVDTTTNYATGKFDAKKVFANSTDAVLRLVTVGGAFAGEKQGGNFVVDTHLTATR